MKILFVDDHPLVHKGLEMVIGAEEDFDIVGLATNGNDAVQMMKEYMPDVALVDLRLPGEHGLDIVRKAREVNARCKFVVLTSFATEEEIRRALDENVDGYILKESLPEELISAIRMVGKGRKYYDPAVVQYAMDHTNNKGHKSQDDLTRREQEVLLSLAHGMSNKVIAEKLVISEHTVKKHIGQILEKLHLKDRTQAALYAVSKGLLKEGP